MADGFRFECQVCGFKDEDEDRKRLALRARMHAAKHEPSHNARDTAEQGITEG